MELKERDTEWKNWGIPSLFIPELQKKIENLTPEDMWEKDEAPAPTTNKKEKNSLKPKTNELVARTFKSGDKYIGGVNSQGKKHGQGKYIFHNGDVYEGEFKNGTFTKHV